MAGLTVTVRLLLGRFEGTVATEPEGVSWPPAPARLFSALVAAGPEGAEREALRWLEAQDPPVIRASPAFESPPHGVFLPTSEVVVPGSHQTYPGRAALSRTRRRCFSQDPTLQYVWDEAPPADTLAALASLARRVPYLGRATSPAAVEVSAEPSGPVEGWLEYRPWSAPGGDCTELAVPYEGFLDDLNRAYKSGQRFDHPVTSWYRIVDAGGEADGVDPSTSPWSYLAIWALPVGLRLPGELVLAVTTALRRAVLSLAPTPSPPVLSGHPRGGPHCAYLALPFVDQEHADGHLLGVAVAVPAEHRQDRVVAAALARLGELAVPGIGRFPLRKATTSRLWGLAPERWQGPARRWATAVPAVLDHHPRRSLSLAEVVARGCRFAGLPEPTEVEASRAPLVRGALALRPHQVRRKTGEPLRPYTHLRLVFDQPVRGPVLVGAKRHFGLGLCIPVEDS